MIMEGLDTLVAPSHHAFLLTESAAAAHFNVLSFDTCLFKSATVSTSPGPVISNGNNNNSSNNINNNNNMFTANHNGATGSALNMQHHLQHSHLLQHQHQHSPQHQQQQDQHTQATGTGTGTGANNHLSLLTTTSNNNNNSGNNGNGNGNNAGQSNGGGASGGAGDHAIRASNVQASSAETQQGDLNTPVTTSSDVPSFFGPSTVIEPPPITSKCSRVMSASISWINDFTNCKHI